MFKNRITRITLGAAIALGTVGATLAGAAQNAAPALAQAWHGGGGYWDRYHHWHGDGWRDRWGHWHAYGAPAGYWRGPRYYDRGHGYWRDRAGYWDPRSGVYVQFRF